MLSRTFRIGTRNSPLALKQVEEVLDYLKRFYPQMKVEIIGIDTYGDKDKIIPISNIEGTDFFTREIDEALLRGDIDFAVHSAKDLPDQIPVGLVIAAITESIDPYDALVSKNNLKIGELGVRAKIGVSSERRKTQLKEYRTDFQIIDIRGNVEVRLEKLDKSRPFYCEGKMQSKKGRDKDGLDAIIVASCALLRLGLEDRIAQRIPFEILRPHPLQGSLAIEVRDNDKKIINLFSKLDMRKEI